MSQTQPSQLWCRPSSPLVQTSIQKQPHLSIQCEVPRTWPLNTISACETLSRSSISEQLQLLPTHCCEKKMETKSLQSKLAHTTSFGSTLSLPASLPPEQLTFCVTAETEVITYYFLLKPCRASHGQIP